ncbi:MAG: hypothetical protein JW910_01170 [Anaerolineae bacterium]|nr:hypothetical protein [Anaerolineae bacterium]
MMQPDDVIRQRGWTEQTLREAGFRYYERRKQLVLVRELPAAEAPKMIEAPWATLKAEAGHMIVYQPSYERRENLDDYDHWPVRRDLFDATYAAWEVPDQTASPGVMHLMELGCQPYYKFAGAWAKRVQEPTRIQSLESEEPITVPPGGWVLIGQAGEPWSQSDDEFRARYLAGQPYGTAEGHTQDGDVRSGRRE